MAAKRKSTLKKAPQAPRRFRSAFIFFSSYKHKQLRLELDSKIPTPTVAKMVSSAWKALSDQERGYWEQLSARDKARFKIEKARYHGPWKVSKSDMQFKGDDSTVASKIERPMSAFVAFSNSKRHSVQEARPDLSLADIDHIVTIMWRQATPEERAPYLEERAILMQTYKAAMTAYKQHEAAVKQRRESMAAQQAVELGLCSMAAAVPWVLVGANEEEARGATRADVVTSSSSSSSSSSSNKNNHNSWSAVAAFLSQENAAQDIFNKKESVTDYQGSDDDDDDDDNYTPLELSSLPPLLHRVSCSAQESDCISSEHSNSCSL